MIQVDIDQRRLGLSKDVHCLVHGDVKQAAASMLKRVQESGDAACLANKDDRLKHVAELKAEWEKKLDDFTFKPSEGDLMKPRHMLREVEKALPENAMVSTDIGNICSVSNSYLRFDQPASFFAAMSYGNCGYAFPAAMGAKMARPDRPSIAYIGDGAWGMSMAEML